MNVTLSLDKNISKVVQSNKYIKWTEVARDAIKQKATEIRKEEIFNKYMKKQKLSEDDNKFIETIDWHPVDELPYADKLIKEIKKADAEKRTKINNLKNLAKINLK